MGCFSIFPCFTSSKHPKHTNIYNALNPTTPTSDSSPDQGFKNSCDSALIKAPTEESTNIRSLQTHFSKPRDDSEGQVINDSENKTSAIDLDVENHEDISTEEVETEIKILPVESKELNEKKVKEECEKLETVMQTENKIKKETQDNEGVDAEIENESDKEKEVKTDVQGQTQTVSDSSASSYISYPPMHRYHNHVINEDEDQVVIQQDSSESLFSLSINPRRQSKSFAVEADDKEVNSPLKTSSSPKMTTKSTNSCPNDSLLNPIENLAQWKTLSVLDLDQEKENLYLEEENITIPVSEDPTFNACDLKGKVKTNTAVTTSLSSWLVEPEKSMAVSNQEESQYSTGNSYAYSYGATSWKSFEERPILGAWTIDEVKQVSARSSPRKSPCRNPDEPIIGTVGSYWSHTMQTTDSSSSCSSPFGRSAKSGRNRQNKALSCHSSPTKRRLDRAFNKGGV
ncbi:uncharacterized protein LOC143544116 isoform X1 [Bidens hawaiensis]|uniref:uncharacterized protein LOC143544116 isoform X1 n=1 Tax=Bidens hawaiensis TaxID=980011 RepID=UPI00404B1570